MKTRTTKRVRAAAFEDIDSDDDDENLFSSSSWAKNRENPPPSYPAISASFVSVKDLKKYGSCSVNFGAFMMVDQGSHDRNYEKMEGKVEKKRENERLKKEKEKRQRAEDKANGKKPAAKRKAGSKKAGPRKWRFKKKY